MGFNSNYVVRRFFYVQMLKTRYKAAIYLRLSRDDGELIQAERIVYQSKSYDFGICIWIR